MNSARRCEECGAEVPGRPGAIALSSGGALPAVVYECQTRAGDGTSHWIRTERAVPNGPAKP